MNYIDLDGNVRTEDSSQDRFLQFAYRHVFFRAIFRVLSVPIFSKIAGALLSSRISALFISGFAKKNGIDLTEYEDRTFRSFNDFFTRKLKPGVRSVSSDESTFVSPSDGKISAYPISSSLCFSVKGVEYTVADILGASSKKLKEEEREKGKAIASLFTEGTALVIRLSPENYHRYHFPVDSVCEDSYEVPGIFLTVNPIIHGYRKVYRENSRFVSLFLTEKNFSFVMIEVGALNVGKIVNHPVLVGHKGEEKGYFSFGGSSIVLLLPKTVSVNPEFFRNTENGYETEIHMGNPIGKVSS